ncbi:MAG: hypothetical protein AAGL49_11015 [Pseudomonadota bacterium]
MRICSGLCSLLFLSASITGVSANDTMDTLTGGANLIVSYQSGEKVSVEFDASGTFATDDGRTGTWTMDGDELCQTVTDGTTGCTTLEAGKAVGDSWTMLDIFGTEVEARIE